VATQWLTPWLDSRMPFSNSNTVLNVLVPELKRNLVGKKYVQSRTSGKKQWEADFTASNSKKELSTESTDIQRLIFIAEAQRCSLTLRQNPGSTKKKMQQLSLTS